MEDTLIILNNIKIIKNSEISNINESLKIFSEIYFKEVPHIL